MTARVTSLTRARAEARSKAAQREINSRLVTMLLSSVAALVIIGLVETTMASTAVAISDRSDQWFFLKRQLLGLGLGTVGLLVAARIPYQHYRRWATPLLFFTFGLLVLVLAVGIVKGGARRWIGVLGFTFQPSELAKPVVIITLAAVMERKRKMLGDAGHFLAPVAAIVGSTAVLVMLEPDLGTTIIIGAGALAVLIASTAPLRFVLTTGVGAFLSALVLAFAAEYRRDRLTSFRDPWADPGGDGYQLIQSLYALGSGGLFGLGLGASRARWQYLPNAHTDFIFAIIGEETGLVGALLVVALFAVITVVGWVVADRAPDPFGRMVAAGITAWISLQAVVNIGGVIGALPITGITLPFVSYGSASLVVTLGSIGILVSIARQGRTVTR